MPAQDHRTLRVFDFDGRAGQARDVPLGQPAIALQRWRRHGQAGVAVLLGDGSVVWTVIT